MRARDVLDTLTGHDEDAVAQATRVDISEMSSFKLVRAMAAVLISRQGDPGPEKPVPLPQAWATVQKMTQAEVQAWWEAQGEDGDDGDDVMPDEPDSEAGKDDSEIVSEPNS